MTNAIDRPLNMDLRHQIVEDRLNEKLKKSEKKVHGLQCKTAQLKAQLAQQKEEMQVLRGELAINKQDFRMQFKRPVPLEPEER